MAIRAVVFDIGGILEIIPEGGDPTQRFPDMIARWEERLGLAPGELDRRITAMDERFSAAGKDGAIGTCTEEEWLAELVQRQGWTRRRWTPSCATSGMCTVAGLIPS